MNGKKTMLTSGAHFIWQLLHDSSNHQLLVIWYVASYLLTNGNQQRNPQNDLVV